MYTEGFLHETIPNESPGLASYLIFTIKSSFQPAERKILEGFNCNRPNFCPGFTTN